VELKSEFLARDAKPTSRVQLDATPRNAFWQLAALKFNSASFIPTKIDAKDTIINDKLEELTPSHDPTFTVDATMLQRQYNEARKLLKKCMQNYRQSGMGNTPSDEKEREANVHKSNTVFNSDFYQFCDGMPSVLYMYCHLLPHGLLESFQADMPEEATHSSDGEQRGVGGPRPSARGGAAAGKLRMLEKVLEAPVAIAQTADQKMQDHYGARLAESRAKMQDEQLSSFKEEELEKCETKIERAGGDQRAPQFLVLKRDRLLAELEKMEREKAASVSAPRSFTDDATARGAGGSAAKSKKRKAAHDERGRNRSRWCG